MSNCDEKRLKVVFVVLESRAKFVSKNLDYIGIFLSASRHSSS